LLTPAGGAPGSRPRTARRTPGLWAVRRPRTPPAPAGARSSCGTPPACSRASRPPPRSPHRPPARPPPSTPAPPVPRAGPPPRPVEQRADRGEPLLAGQPRPLALRRGLRPQPRQRPAEPGQPGELLGVLRGAERRVVAVLLAAAGVSAGGLEVAVRARTDPHVL